MTYGIVGSACLTLLFISIRNTLNNIYKYVEREKSMITLIIHKLVRSFWVSTRDLFPVDFDEVFDY